jgi:hypothetical protein
MTTSSASPYLSYLLRLWQAGDNDQPQWSAALIDPQTGERYGFSNLEALTAHLHARMEELTCLEAEGTNHILQHSGPRVDPPICGFWPFPYLAVCC